MHELLEAGIHWSLINFTIFVGLLFFFLRKPVKEFWKSREGEIRFEIEESMRLGREARAQYEELKKMLSRTDTESKDLILSLEREGEMEKKRLMEEGARRSERLKQDSLRIIDQETRKARELLKQQVASQALETAEKMIRDNIQAQDQKRILDQYVTGLERQAV